MLTRSASGGVVEWLMAPVLKTGEAQASVGSNPTPSASYVRVSAGVAVLVRNADREMASATATPISAAKTTSDR